MQTGYNGKFGFEKLKGDLHGNLFKSYGNFLSQFTYVNEIWLRKY